MFELLLADRAGQEFGSRGGDFSRELSNVSGEALRSILLRRTAPDSRRARVRSRAVRMAKFADDFAK
ncbi:hypothetical protein [Cupriavidus sp. a3]|uniref:hypothetical protein n=1 Tax=Cupriavidus sp. a3 TaxID=3242158 RepID=UPI003D9C51D5